MAAAARRSRPGPADVITPAGRHHVMPAAGQRDLSRRGEGLQVLFPDQVLWAHIDQPDPRPRHREEVRCVAPAPLSGVEPQPHRLRDDIDQVPRKVQGQQQPGLFQALGAVVAAGTDQEVKPRAMPLRPLPRKQRIGSASTIGVWISSRTGQGTWSPSVFHVTVHRPGQSPPRSSPDLPASTGTATRNSSHPARWDHSGPAARPAPRALSLRSMHSRKRPPPLQAPEVSELIPTGVGGIPKRSQLGEFRHRSLAGLSDRSRDPQLP
jgi:hypothetical protein